MDQRLRRPSLEKQIADCTEILSVTSHGQQVDCRVQEAWKVFLCSRKRHSGAGL